jgi:ribosome biogenesis GTPase A
MSGIDVVIELLDARLPGSSANPLLATLTAGKPALKLLNKQDLADPLAHRAVAGALQTPSPTHAPSAWTPAKPPLRRA